MRVSVVIPVFNEEKTVAKIVKRVDRLRMQGVESEMIGVDDG